MTSERELIRQLQQRFPVRPPVEVGIGDDGAVLRSGSDRQIVVTDMLLDGVHFDLQTTSPALVGRKALAVNLSDLAAMACWPTAAFISIAVSRSLAAPAEFLSQLYDGMEQLAQRYKFSIAGGDTNSWHGPFAINVCMTGHPVGQHPVLRTGARAGDLLFVTGPLGGSLQTGRHLSFEPRLETARWLVDHVDVHAMLDISDGLGIDLHRMLEASNCGATVEAARIPCHEALTVGGTAEDRLQHALQDGEDFELLFAAPPTALKLAEPEQARPKFWQIGSVETDTGCRLRSASGMVTDLLPSGWQHL